MAVKLPLYFSIPTINTTTVLRTGFLSPETLPQPSIGKPEKRPKRPETTPIEHDVLHVPFPRARSHREHDEIAPSNTANTSASGVTQFIYCTVHAVTYGTRFFIMYSWRSWTMVNRCRATFVTCRKQSTVQLTLISQYPTHQKPTALLPTPDALAVGRTPANSAANIVRQNMLQVCQDNP